MGKENDENLAKADDKGRINKNVKIYEWDGGRRTESKQKIGTKRDRRSCVNNWKSCQT